MSKNREGIFGLIGFTTLSFLGEDVGRRSIWEPLSHDCSKGDIMLRLFAKGYIMLATARAFQDCISRRLTNASYVMWIGGHSTICLSVLSAGDFLSRTSYVYTSPCLDFISSNQLEVFLVANVILGVTNMSIKSHEKDTVTSVVILIMYMLAVMKSTQLLTACKACISRYMNRNTNKQGKVQRSHAFSRGEVSAPR